MIRPSLIDRTKLKPKIEIPEPELPSIDTIKESVKIPTLDNRSISALINVVIIAILSSAVLWLYTIYVDRRDTKITPLLEIESEQYQVPILSHGNPNNLSNTVPENIYTNGKNDFTLF